MSNSLMILGTASSVGKSTVSTALCRYLKKKGYNVAPFKSLSTSLNSSVTDKGEEIGRAQLVQAEACEVLAEGIMNPVLIKTSINKKTQVIVNGKVYCNMENYDYETLNKDLKSFVKDSYESLSNKYENIIIEGSGSCCEINLRDTDIANFYTAKVTNSDVILVSDIDKGGLFASLYGTVNLLDESERNLIKGVIINKFKGNLEDLKPVLNQIEELIKIPILGVLPYEDLDIEDEDSVTQRLRCNKKSGLNIAIIKLPHMSNLTDFYPLELEKNINIRYVKIPKELEGANLIIIPGSKNAIYDLDAMKENGLFDKILDLHKNGASIMGICSGFQMLGKSIVDTLGSEGEKRIIDGFDLLPLKTKFALDKKTTISKGIVCAMENELKDISNIKVYGYEIHNGCSEMIDGQGEVFIIDSNSNVTGISNAKGDVLGTYIHGIFEGADFRHTLLTHFKEKYNVVIENSFEEKENYKKYKLEQYDKLCNTFEKNIDINKVLEILYKKKSGGDELLDD